MDYELLNQIIKEQKRKKRIAAYCRVSSEKDDQANSFENQQRYFKQYIENNPEWELYEIFADEGISGTSTKKRTAFNQMISQALCGEFDLIITKEISRFARNTLDSIYYTRKLKKNGVGVIFLNDNINTLDNDAELRLTIMSSMAQEESRKTSERVKWGQKRQMEQGVVFGRSLLGYDVKDGKMTINEEGAKIVRLIFYKFVVERKGTTTIARELTEAGIYPMTCKKWNNTVILRILRNEKYCGDLIQKKTYTPDYLTHEKKYNRGEEEFVIIRNHHEAIISREMFNKAKEILDERSLSQKGKSKHSNRYPFSGKIQCGICGARYVARYKTRKDGSKYKSWCCYEANTHGKPHVDGLGNKVGCYSYHIRNEELVHLMALTVRELKLHTTNIKKETLSIIKTVLKSNNNSSEINNITIKLDELNNRKSKLLEVYLSGVISKDEFTATRANLDNEENELNTKLSTLTNGLSTNLDVDKLIDQISQAIDEIFNGIEPDDDDFYKHILNKIVITRNETIDIYLNLFNEKFRYSSIQDTFNKDPTPQNQAIQDSFSQNSIKTNGTFPLQIYLPLLLKRPDLNLKLFNFSTNEELKRYSFNNQNETEYVYKNNYKHITVFMGV